MSNPFIRKLDAFVPLSAEHRQEFERLTSHVQHLQPREHIIRQGDVPHVVNVVLSGWVCRYKTLPDGQRQIISIFLPGDMCDPYVFLFDLLEQSLVTLTPVILAKVPAQTIRDMTASGPELTEALWWQMLVITEIQREWTVSLGRRTAVQRLAHLFCEVFARLSAVGLSDGSECDFPLTQSHLADSLGLSQVHINRCLQDLRTTSLVTLRSKRLTINDHERLMDFAAFDPAYLHHR